MNFIEAIEALFELATHNPLQQLLMVDIGLVDEILAQKIKENTGFEVRDYTISMDNYGVKHILNRHTDKNVEDSRNQIVVQKTDFQLLREVIYEADEIIDAGKTSRNQNGAILFQKQIDNLYVVILEIRVVSGKKKVLYKKNRLVLQSLRIIKTP